MKEPTLLEKLEEFDKRLKEEGSSLLGVIHHAASTGLGIDVRDNPPKQRHE